MAQVNQLEGRLEAMRVAKPKPRPYIWCDTREQRVLRFPPELGVDCGTAKLDAGDYAVRGFSHLFIAERKNLSDLCGSLTSGRERFLDELQLLKQFKWPIIVVEARQDEAEIGAYRSRVLPQSISGSLDAIWMRYGIPTRWCGDAAGAARYIAWVAHRLETKYAELKETSDAM